MTQKAKYWATWTRGGSSGGRTRRARPLKLEKIWYFGVKSWFFARNTPKMFAPPSARRNFFKCAPPLTWNPGSAPGSGLYTLEIGTLVFRKDDRDEIIISEKRGTATLFGFKSLDKIFQKLWGFFWRKIGLPRHPTRSANNDLQNIHIKLRIG